jgi:hypothetical protein
MVIEANRRLVALDGEEVKTIPWAAVRRRVAARLYRRSTPEPRTERILTGRVI